MHGLLISDFNIGNLASYLEVDRNHPIIKARIAPYDQIAQTLLDPSQACWQDKVDFALIWSRPDNAIETIRESAAGSSLNRAKLCDDVDRYTDRVATASQRVRYTFVPTWVLPTFHLGNGIEDLTFQFGISRAMMYANQRLLENLDALPSIVALNTSKWIELAGIKAFNSRLWYGAKIPYGNEVFMAAATEIKTALRVLEGGAKKLIVLDLDETIWGGVVGDVGWQNIVLGGHDAIGEALADFQREIKALAKRGIILSIVSKNEEKTALEAIDNHPEMILRRSDFAGWRINWADKAENIEHLAADLNLALDSVVFIDDNPVERDRVRQALPQVTVPEWPTDKRLYPDAIRSLNCFSLANITDEDRKRVSLYAHERERKRLKAHASSVDEWLESLNLRVRIERLTPLHLSRATQLLNKTNQLNLTTRRMSESELARWAASENRFVWVIFVADRFGDSGLTGVMSVESDSSCCRVVDFVLSCRVMGRKIEETMLYAVVKWARSLALPEVRLTYIPTARNAPCFAFLRNSGLCVQGEVEFFWPAERDYALHRAVHLTCSLEEGAGRANEGNKSKETLSSVYDA